MNIEVGSVLGLSRLGENDEIVETISVHVLSVDPDPQEECDGDILARGEGVDHNILIFHGDQEGLIWSSPDRPSEEFFGPEHPRVKKLCHVF
jgi:hypothetical protein